MIQGLLLAFFAGLATLLGSFVIFFVKKKKRCYLNVAMGFSAGVMLFVSFTELLNESIEDLGYFPATLAFFGGMVIIFVLDSFIPHEYEAEEACSTDCLKQNKKLKRCGLLIALGVGIHNLPEGMAVFFSSLADLELGLVMAIAIALHNIPEGIAVALPIYYATKSKSKAFLLSLVSGLAEPIGALISFLIFGSLLNQTMLSLMIAAVAGIMVFISFDELLPFAYEETNDNVTIAGIFAGMGVMALSLDLI
jgi:ZIP family zinc transporter